MGTIYVLRNVLNGKCYVGQTRKTARERIRDHRSSESPLGQAFRKYGIKSFELQIFYLPDLLLDDFEIELIQRLDSVSPGGYNLAGGGFTRKIVTDEMRRKIGEASSQRRHSTETRRKMGLSHSGANGSMWGRRGKDNPQFGRKHTLEARKKMSLVLQGHAPTFIGKGQANPMFGKHHSVAARIKMSEERRGNKNAFWGKNHSEETRRKMREAWDRRRGQLWLEVK